MTVAEFDLIKALFQGVKTQIKMCENKIDELGKVVQTPEGNGTMEDPYKGWQVGKEVKAGKWYKTYDGYLWEAKKDGYPSSSIDYEYFDVVGV